MSLLEDVAPTPQARGRQVPVPRLRGRRYESSFTKITPLNGLLVADG
ncbi:MAG: hypothetical protein ACLQVM_30670 [Terriglobia bacterium]